MKYLMIATIALMLGGCDLALTRAGIGTTYVEVPCDRKYMHASWKDADGSVWYAHRQASPGEAFSDVVYQQVSALGVIQGKMVFKERKCFQ